MKYESAVLGGKVTPKRWLWIAFFMKSSAALDLITGLQLTTMQSSLMGKGGLSAFSWLRVRWHRHSEVGQYLDNRFSLSLPRSSNVKGPGKGQKTPESEGQQRRTRAQMWVTFMNLSQGDQIFVIKIMISGLARQTKIYLVHLLSFLNIETDDQSEWKY